MSEYPPGGRSSARESVSESLKQDAAKAADFFDGVRRELKAKGVSVEALERADDEMSFIMKSPVPQKNASEAVQSGALADAITLLRDQQVAIPQELKGFLGMFGANDAAPKLEQVELRHEDQAAGRTARIDQEYKPKSSKDKRTKRRTKGGKKAVGNISEEAAENTSPAGPELPEGAPESRRLAELRASFDQVYGYVLKARHENPSPSSEMSAVWDAYVDAVQEFHGYEDAVEEGGSSDTREVELLTKALTTAERYLSLAANSRASGSSDSETPAESRRALREKVQEMENLKEARNQLSGEGGIQEKYFSALEAFNRKRGAVSIAAADWIGHEALTPKELTEMRKEWLKSRAALSRTMRASVDARVEATPSSARDSLLERMNEKYGNTERASLHARYERRYGRAAIIIDAEREELAARERGLSSREKGLLDRMYDRYKNLPPGVRILSTSALMIGGAAALAGTPVGWTALGLAGSGALVRWAAEARKSSALGMVGSALSISGVIGLGLDKMAGLVHAVAGTKGRAAKTLKQTEGFGNLGDVKNLEKAANKRRAALNAEANIVRHKRWARVLGSIGAGWLLGHSGSASGSENASDAADTASGQEAGAPAPESPTTGTEASVPAAEPVGQTAGAPAAPVEAVPFTPEHVATIESGEGFNSLFSDLQESIRASGDTDSLVAQRLLSMSPTELSDSINAFDPETGGSMVMQPGDRLYIDEHQNLVFERAGETTTLMDAQNGTVETHAFENPRMLGERAEVAALEEVRTEPEEAPAAETQVEDVPATVAPIETAGVGSPEFISDYSNPEVAQAPSAGAEPTPVPSSSESSQPQFIRDYISTESASDVLTNGHGVEITPDTPAAYELWMPGSDQPYIVVSGGEPGDASLVAQQYANEHPGTTVYFETPVRDPLTGQVHARLDAWDSVASSSAERRDNIVPDLEFPGARVPSMNTDDFTRRLTSLP